jgi:DeoR/GlpR family transcriptional regulator of sugar metabolism
MKKKFAEERYKKILEYINSQNRVNVDELAVHFNVTKVTVRRDLQTMEEQGLIYRAHGGAVKRERPSVWQISSLQTRLGQYGEEKTRIAQYIAQIIQDGESIMIDGGSTTTLVARELRWKKNLLIVTNALTIAELLLESDTNKVILTGGELLKETNALIGNAAEHSIASYRTDMAIIGVSALVPAEGCFAAIPQEAEVKSLMLRNARKRIIVTDSSKIGITAFAQFCEIASIDLLVTDKNISRNDLAVLKKAGIEVEAV